MNELFNKLLDDTFFDLYSHFKNKRQFYNDLGVELLTLAIFLKDHLTTDEPFPPTKDFINTVKKNIDYELHFENLENPENITKEKILKTNKKEDIKMLLTVHDELLFEIKKDKVKYFSDKIKNIMENIIKLKVPIVVDVKTGNNWGDLKKL